MVLNSSLKTLSELCIHSQLSQIGLHIRYQLFQKGFDFEVRSAKFTSTHYQLPFQEMRYFVSHHKKGILRIPAQISE